MTFLHKPIPSGSTQATTGPEIAAELQSQLGSADFAAIFFFTAGGFDLDVIGRSITDSYPGVLVIGCTTAGLIDRQGYNDAGVNAFALPRSHFTVEAERLAEISQTDITTWQSAAKKLVLRLGKRTERPLAGHTFGFMLVDGLSLAEETVLSAIYPELGEIPLFGGSTGDDLEFRETRIFMDGRTFSDAAALVLVNTSCPFKVFRTQHFVETEKKMVITEADPVSRIAKEINATPAAEEYARLIGEEHSELSPLSFAKNPLMVKVGGSYYVRSIQRPEEHDGLRFFCAIDEGLVLTLAKGIDLAANLQQTLDRVKGKVGTPALIIGCDCIFRKLELKQVGQNKMADVSRILTENNVVGFSTYGEQYAGMHVNQTFTGVAIVWPDD